MAGSDDRNGSALRPSGYASRFYEFSYAVASPLYDLVVWWGFLPLGGEAAVRREFTRWIDPAPGLEIASLCCGTGSMERAMLQAEPALRITGVDLGRGQIARARRKDRSGRIEYRVGNAADTGLPEARFDRVVITLALHEMPRELRLRVLREAARICRPEGRVVAIEHGRPPGASSRLFQALWWFFWIPRNPEVATSRDLQRRGLANEMRECGLRPLERHATDRDWIEGFVASPSAALDASARAMVEAWPGDRS
jgi:ubiquinone/menaquinone biosynthesis C-methylase UbiE